MGQNVYTVQLTKPIETVPSDHHYTGRQATYLHVVASSYANVVAAVEKKYPGVKIQGIQLLNYLSVPIVIGE
jgi:hypothetical protein